MKQVPAILVIIRTVCGPVLLVCTVVGSPGGILAGLVTVAFVSDVFDGIIARRLGVATEALRRADSVVDTCFYLCAIASLTMRSPQTVVAHWIGISCLVGLELARVGVERVKYGRIASYHMWSAKAWGITLWLGFSEVFLVGQAGPFFQAAIVVGILADSEGLLASALLSKWTHDIPSLWHAVQIERRNQDAA